jgi:hypothetical protein
MVTLWPAEVVSVKPDVDRLLTVPAAPPAAGPDRALDPPPDPGTCAKPPLAVDEPLLATAGLAAEVALTIPYAPPAIATAAAPATRDLVSLREDMVLTS